MKSFITLAIGTSLLFFSCNSNREHRHQSLAPEIVEAHGYVVPKAKVSIPVKVPAQKQIIVPARKPKEVSKKTNIHEAGIPMILKADVPNESTRGNDSFSLPETVPAIDSPFIAGTPEVVLVNSKDQNSQNFTSFGILQGLTSNDITSLVEDKHGNLWIATMGGGVSRYDGKSFTNFTIAQGLSNDYVRCMLEDRDGNLWFGFVEWGVCKFDGRSFTRYTTKEGLADNNVASMIEDISGNLWFGTADGVNKYDGKKFTHFTRKQGLMIQSVAKIFEDKSGDIWFSDDGKIEKYDSKNFTHYNPIRGDHFYTPLNEDKEGNLWFSSELGLSRSDGQNHIYLTRKNGLRFKDATCFLQDRYGNMWFGTSNSGVIKYDGKNLTSFTTNEGLSNNYITCMIQDKHGNVWVGTAGGGLNKYNGKIFNHFTTREGLSENLIVSIIEDKKGDLWFGTFGSGANKYDNKSFTHFTHEEGLPNYAVVCMLSDNKGNLWFGSWNGLSKYDGKNFYHFTEQVDPKDMLEDKNGNIWLSTHGQGVYKYDGENFENYTDREGLSNNIVLSMIEDKKGNFWFATFGGGITRYDGDNFKHFTVKEGLSDNYIFRILEDDSGNIWIATAYHGISKYDGKNFIHFTEKQGLSSNEVLTIMKDKLGNIWFGTANGINRLDKKYTVPAADTSAPYFKTYTYEDGFTGIGVNFGKTMHESNDGTIWIGANDRLTTFHPKGDLRDTIAPGMQLTGIALFHEYIDWKNLRYSAKRDTGFTLGNGVFVHDLRFDDASKWYGVPEQLSLASDNNSISFQFVGITIQSPGKVKYQYKLEGQDENWSALTSRSEATYGNLPHGKYTFKVKAMNGEGYWSNEYQYSFTIRPPWWHTWWAYTLFVLLSTGIIYSLFRYRLNKIRMKHQLAVQQHKVTELEMQTLRAQMNPHFIFNSLNSINLFILENNKLQASEYLSKFSRLVRLILNNSREAFISLEQELEALELYLELESLRFDQKFKYEIEVDRSINTSGLKVPPLIIQPYAENAIWHGLMNKKEEGHLEISLYQEQKKLFCKICDDGIGRKKSAEIKSKSTSTRKSVGMQITAERIAMFQHQGESSTNITVRDVVLPDGSPGGTEVIITIPFRS